jgi:hypothetical protein
MENQQLGFLARQRAESHSLKLRLNKVAYFFSCKVAGSILNIRESDVRFPA